MTGANRCAAGQRTGLALFLATAWGCREPSATDLGLARASVVVETDGDGDGAGDGTFSEFWRLLTTHSTSGSFVLMADTDTCPWTELPVALLPTAGGDAVPVSPRMLGPCLMAYEPAAPLAEGEYCVELEAPRSDADSCFTVTGQTASLADATLTYAISQEPTQGRASCFECDDAQECTRLRYEYIASVGLTGVAPEISASHLFAVTVALSDDEDVELPLPEASDWKALDGLLGLGSVVSSWLPDFACIGVYARPFASEEAALVTRVCIPRPRTTFPSSPGSPSGCREEYIAHWCEDNREDCTQDELAPDSVAPCEQYADKCFADGGVRPGAADSPVDEDAGSESDQVEDAAPESSAASSSGCSAAPASTRGWLWLVFFALAVWGALRARRV